jgi:hypothetical protein
MPDTAARLALIARRYEVARFTIAVTGIDMTGVDMKMQVRLQRGTPGAPLLQLGTVTTIAAEGLKLDSVTVTDGVPTSIIKGRINKTTMDTLPFAGELGADTVLAYAMQWMLNGDAQTRLEGDFIVRDSAFGSDNAPADRPESYGSSLTRYTSASSGSLTFGDQVVQVSIGGLDLLAAGLKPIFDAAAAMVAPDTILGAAASTAADRVATGADVVAAGQAASDSQLAGAAAAAFVNGKLFATTAAGVAGTASEQYFLVAASGATSLPLYLNNGGSAVSQNLLLPTLGAVGPGARTYSMTISGAGAAALKPEQAKIRMTTTNTLVFTGMTFYAVGKNAGSALSNASALKGYYPAGGLVGSFTFVDEDRLLWIWDGTTYGTVQIVNATAAQPTTDYMVLAHFKSGKFCTGAFLPLIRDAIAERQRPFQRMLYTPISGSSPLPQIIGNRITFTKGRWYGGNEDGAVVDYFAGLNAAGTARADNLGFTATFVAAENDIIIWDREPGILNPIRKVTPPALNTTAFLPARCVILATYKDGRWLSETMPQVNAADVLANSTGKSIPGLGEMRCQVITGKDPTQSLVTIGSQIWSFASAASDHSAPAPVYVHDKDTFAKLFTGTHNISHASNADYRPDIDTLMLSNGSLDAGDYPRLDFFPGFGREAEAAPVIDWNTTPRVSIPFYVLSGTTLTKSLLGAGEAAVNGAIVGCWTGRPDEIYILFDTGSAWAFFRVLLGTGTANYSDASGTDTSRWGTFIPGKAAGELNGTALISSGPHGGAKVGVSQGLIFNPRNGELLMPFSTTDGGRQIIEAIGIVPTADGTFKVTPGYKRRTYTAAGALSNFETEGGTIVDGRYLVMGSQGGGNNWYRFPLAGEMGGKGTVGGGGLVTIAFPFPVNSGPQVSLTPTNASGAGCYVSAADPVAGTFAVAGPAGATFNWNAPIS